MDDFRGKWALVTGASSGLGVDFATLLAERGAHLVLVARRGEPMQQLALALRAKHGVHVVVEAMDLAQPGAAAALKSRLDARGQAIDILVNNAGYGVFGAFHEQALQGALEMLQLNVTCLTELTHLFAADMVRRRAGHILLVASIVAYQATPGYAAYSASKAYVLLFGEALHVELAPHNVKVSVLSPGVTATGFMAVSGQRPTAFTRLMTMRSRPVALRGLDALAAGSASVMPGLANRLVVFFNRFTPRALQARITDVLMRH